MKWFCVILILYFYSSRICGQPGQGGVYASAEDFEKGKFMFSFPCDSVKTKIKLNGFINSSFITIRSQGQIHRFDKAEIFGFRDCTSATFRVYDHAAYEILNRKPFFLYVTESVRNKSSETERVYFFSKRATDPLLPLTMFSLKKTFPENHAFQDLLHALFKNDEDLIRLDHGTNRYTIMRIYSQSLDTKQ